MNPLYTLLLTLILSVLCLALWYTVNRILRLGTYKQVDSLPTLVKFRHRDLPLNSRYIESKPKPRVSRNTALLSPRQLIEFDPLNFEHQVALCMMLRYTRQHPELRFNYDPAAFDNAFYATLVKYAEAMFTPQVLAEATRICRLKTKKRRSKKATLVSKEEPKIVVDIHSRSSAKSVL